MLVIAVVVSVLLLTLGLAMSNILTAETKRNAVEYYGVMAYGAAQSGVERTLVRLYTHDHSVSELECSDLEVGTLATPGDGMTFDSGQLKNCEIDIIDCKKADDVAERMASSGFVDVYRFTSYAQCGASNLDTSRSIVVEVKREDKL